MIISNTNNNLITALYCRLSHEDELRGDSMSIQNQKELLGNYAAQNGFLLPNTMLMTDIPGGILTARAFSVCSPTSKREPWGQS